MSSVIKSQRLLMSDPLDLSFEERSPAAVTDDAVTDDADIELTADEEQQEPDPKSVAEEIIAEATARAEEIIDAASAKAEQIIAVASDHADAVTEKARQQGYDEGFDSGLDAGEEALGLLEQEARQILDNVCTERNRVLSECKEQLVELALEITKRLVAHELSSKPETVADQAEQALQMIKESERCTIRVHPRDILVVEEKKRQLRRSAPDVGELEIVGDESLEPGEIMVDSTRGQVDGTITTKLATARDALMEVVHDEDD